MVQRKLPRGLRNCNPGNIRKSPTRYLGEVQPSKDPAFKQFESMAWGYRALFVLLDSYCRRGVRTIREIISRYAPPVENYTEGYIRVVAESAGLPAESNVDMSDHDLMVRIAAAISRVENGRAAILADVEQGWQLYKTHKP